MDPISLLRGERCRPPLVVGEEPIRGPDSLGATKTAASTLNHVRCQPNAAGFGLKSVSVAEKRVAWRATLRRDVRPRVPGRQSRPTRRHESIASSEDDRLHWRLGRRSPLKISRMPPWRTYPPPYGILRPW